MVNRQSAIGNRQSRRDGFAILMVVLVLVALAIIAAPFAISMRQEEHASRNFAARARAKLGAEGALNWAKAQLERSHDYFEELETRQGSPPTVYNSPQVDARGEIRVDLTSTVLTEGEVALDIADHQGAMWGVTATDEQGKVNIKTASRAFLRNLFELLFGTSRGHAIADAIIQYRDVNGRQFTSLTQIREVGASITAAEFDRMAGFLTVHSAALVGDTPSGEPALHPLNINTCTEEALRAWLLGLKLVPQEGMDDHEGVTAAEVNNLILRLRVFTTLGESVSQGATSVLLDNATAMPDSGWVSIEGDAVKFTARTGNRISVADPIADPTVPLAARVDEDHPRLTDMGLQDVEVRLLFTDIENDLASVLDTMVAAGELSEGSRSAILANAINPRNAEALDTATTTAPLCFRSFNIYTIEATGVVNGQDGRELARYTVRQVAQVAPRGNLEIRIETQNDFEQSLVSGQGNLVATFPNATQVSDIPAENVELAATVLLRRGRLGLKAAEVTPAASTSFGARYNGEMRGNTLWAEPELSRLPEPDALTTVRCEPGEEGDVEPEGVHVGVRQIEGRDPEKRILVYKARQDDEEGEGYESNIPHGGEYISPFIIETWVKFDPAGEGPGQFDYGKDHFLFDLAETTWTNRIALYYDSTVDSADGTGEGDLVLYVCDATLQRLPAQVRAHVTSDTFEPQRWYHLAAVVKGIGYNQMALLINGQSVGEYEPSAALSSDLAQLATTVSCDGLATYSDSKYFAPFRWPPAQDTAIAGGELIEFLTASDTTLSGCTRGARGTQARKHYAGTRVEIYGYDDLLRQGSWYHSDTEYLIDHLLKAGEEPALTKALPAEMAAATVDDGDEQEPPVAPTIAIDLTADGTTDYWTPVASKYEAAELDGNAIPAEGWLPIAFSEMWLIEGKDTPIADDEAKFTEVAEDETFQAFLLYNETGTTLGTGQRTLEDALNGLGFLRVEKNETGEGDKPGEVIKYSQAGVVLVWRKIAEDDPATEDVDEEKRVAWYIGYLAGFGQAVAEGEEASSEGRRGCFETEEAEIVEGATLRFDCIKLTHNMNLPRGHREEVSWTYTDINGQETTYDMGRLTGRGIFQLYRDPSYYEWIDFCWPQYKAETDELALLNNCWLVGIVRARADTVPDGDEHTGREFLAGGADKILPVFFTHNQVRVMNQYLPIIKGPGDQVTLLDRKGDRKEEHVVCHGSGHLFAFREPVQQTYLYADNPRVLKFPSGSLPMKPDDLMFIGSDSDFDDQFSAETGDTTDPAGEPERPANATFDEIKVYPAGSYATVGLYDFEETGGQPPTEKAGRWKQFSIDSDAPPISDSLAPPFYIRIGHLERISPKPTGDPPVFQQPFRFISNGHASWPMEGYLKIDDECMFFRTMYYNRDGGHSAKMLFQPGKPKDEDGLTYALRKSDNDIYVGFEEGKDFPEQGYLTFSSSWPSRTYWDRFAQVAADSGQGAAALWAWLKEGNFILGEGGRMSSSGHVAHQERLFYDSKERTTVNGQDAWKLHLADRAILDSSIAEAKYVDETSTPSWYIEGMTSVGGATCRVFPCELLVLKRGCLGTGNAEQQTTHGIGTIVMPLEHIPTSLTPRPAVKLKRDLETGLLERDPEDANLLATLDDDSTEFDLTKPEYEYGIVVEDVDSFPAEGYVQIGDEILAYAQDRNGNSPVWNAKVRMWDEAQATWVEKVMPVLTGVKHFRQRYGTARASYLDYKPGESGALKHLDPGVPDPAKEPGDAGYKIQPTPPYWDDNWKHIVHVREFRYYDRYPQKEPATPGAAADTYVGQYSPHPDDGRLAYYEFAVTLPGTLWTRVQWAELLYRKEDGVWQFSNDPLSSSDDYDVKVLVQIDGQPGWDDMTMDEAVQLNGAGQPPQPVATPVHWRDEFPNRTDVYDPDPGSHRPLKPIIYLFDEAYDPDETTGRPDNFINPYRSGTSLSQRGQYGDRLRLRVLFQYRNKDHQAPDYVIPWRTPFVDTIIINYQAPTYVMEHREMPY